MNEATPQPGRTRRWMPLAVAVLFGVALAMFAGMSTRGDDASDDAAYGVEGSGTDRSARLAAGADELDLPVHPDLELEEVAAPPISVDGRSVELRVLLLVHGADEDADAAEQVRETLDVLGIAHDVVLTDTEAITPELLRDGDRGRYNGIILTDAELLTAEGRSGLNQREWSLLESYSRDFSVRQVILSGFPGSTERYDYGLVGAEVVESPTAEWTSAAVSVFAGVAREQPLEVSGSAFAAMPRSDGFGPVVEPLLIGSDGDGTLISLVRYPDGREAVVSGIPMGVSHVHSHALVYDFIRFATSGLHLGAARAHLAVHVDDLFLDYRGWDNDRNTPEAVLAPNTPGDIAALAAHQEDLTSEFDTLDAFAIDFPFNGVGAALASDGQDATGDALTDAVLEHRDRFRFLNHTYQHRDLDVSAGAGATEARDDLLWNRVMWDLLGLPQAEANASVVVTGEHSGVWDDPLDGDPSAQVPFPEGLNTEMAAAFEEAGVRYLAGDASEGSQAADQQVPGYEIVLLPRHPTGVLLNASNPEQQVDQYNWFFNERYLAEGQDPCTIAAATCESVDYAELLGDEAELAMRHMLSFRRWPHYFHMANVVDYDGEGSSLLGDWLSAVMAEYESRSSLPVENLTFAEIGARTEADLVARAANPVGVLDLESGEVVLAAGRAVELRITGLADGEPYGPVLQSTVAVGPEPTRFAVG